MSAELEGSVYSMGKEKINIQGGLEAAQQWARMVEVPLGSSHPPERPHVPSSDTGDKQGLCTGYKGSFNHL